MRKINPDFCFNSPQSHFGEVGRLDARWIGAPEAVAAPVIMMFRLVVELPQAATLTVHVSADERYIFSVNGQEEGRGPERGSLEAWFFESYQIELFAGRNVLCAQVWAAGEFMPHAQMSAGPAFLLVSEDPALELSTGIAAWESVVLDGCGFIPTRICWGRGSDTFIDGTNIDWELLSGSGSGWRKAMTLRHAIAGKTNHGADVGARMLIPATLPPMKMGLWTKGRVRYASAATELGTDEMIFLRNSDAVLAAQLETAWKANTPVIIPPLSEFQAIIDLDDYVCAYNTLNISGGRGAVIDLLWAEALFVENNPDACKGNRDEIDGKYFIGEGDRFISCGGKSRSYAGLWWHSGRYLMLKITTAETPLLLNGLTICQTGYPFEFVSEYNFSCQEMNEIAPIMKRALECCSHETLMDCPYYEQMMYTGDTRLELLAIYTLTNDDRLPRKAIRTLNNSRDFQGRIASRYPSKLRQLIPGFELYWIGMVYDYALWRGDREFVREMMPAVHMTLELFLNHLSPEGLLETPAGWNFMDWVPAWKGIPPVAADGLCASLNFLLVYIMKLAAELDEWQGNTTGADRYRSLAGELARNAAGHFWSEEHMMFADDSDKCYFSEHTQCFAILSGEFLEEREKMIFDRVIAFPEAARSTIYFSHYLFEAARKLKRGDLVLERLRRDWFILRKMGFKTTYETPMPSRSDCHAWGAHPLYHYYASIIGLRPTALGSNKFTIEPMCDFLDHFDAELLMKDKIIKISGRKDHDTQHMQVKINSSPMSTVTDSPVLCEA